MAEKQPTTVQTIILDKEKFSLSQAKKWVKAHGFKTSHAGKGVDETSGSYRFRQRDPGDFTKNSFRTITLADGVKAVIGKLSVKKFEAGDSGMQEAVALGWTIALLMKRLVGKVEDKANR